MSTFCSNGIKITDTLQLKAESSWLEGDLTSSSAGEACVGVVASGVEVAEGGVAGRDRSMGTGDTASCREINGVLVGVTAVKAGGSGARLFMRRRKVPFTEKQNLYFSII